MNTLLSTLRVGAILLALSTSSGVSAQSPAEIQVTKSAGIHVGESAHFEVTLQKSASLPLTAYRQVEISIHREANSTGPAAADTYATQLTTDQDGVATLDYTFKSPNSYELDVYASSTPESPRLKKTILFNVASSSAQQPQEHHSSFHPLYIVPVIVIMAYLIRRKIRRLL